MYTPILEYCVLECHVLRFTSVNFNTFARLKIDQTLVFKLPVGSSARGYEWNFCYSPTAYHHFSDGWHPYYIGLLGMIKLYDEWKYPMIKYDDVPA